MNLFALPIVGRAGLGNMLFPWARAEIFARRSSAAVLRPRWNTLRLGPYRRREPEKRNYIGFFDTAHHLRGMSRLVPFFFGDRFSEAEGDLAILLTAGNGRPAGWRPRVVEFEGLGDYFAPLLTEYEFIRHQLLKITREPMRGDGDCYGGRFIAMHVRRGDLTRQGLSPERLKMQAAYTPTPWFTAMARAVRGCSEINGMPIVLFTDGSREEVAEILNIHNVHLHRRGTAISDLWTLAQARLLFASGFSTFSMWASFLGGMPTIYAPGKIQERVQLKRPRSLEIEVEEGADIPAHLVAPVICQACGLQRLGSLAEDQE